MFYSPVNPGRFTKTESSERMAPLPETLLRLGFREWWHDSFHRPGPLLFPEATTSRRNGKASDNYGKRRKTPGPTPGSPTGTRTAPPCGTPLC